MTLGCSKTWKYKEDVNTWWRHSLVSSFPVLVKYVTKPDKNEAK